MTCADDLRVPIVAHVDDALVSALRQMCVEHAMDERLRTPTRERKPLRCPPAASKRRALRFNDAPLEAPVRE